MQAVETISVLSEEIGLLISPNNQGVIIEIAIKYSFIRDPFDRIIVADASIIILF